MTELSATEVVTGDCRLQFEALFEMKPVAKGSPKLKYQATLLLPPDTDLQPYVTAIKAAAMEKFGGVPKLTGRASPLHPCDEKHADPDKKPPAGFEKGWYYIGANTGFPPGVVDQQLKPILDQELHQVNPQEAVRRARERIYNGCWVRAHLNAWAWDHPVGGKGVSFSLCSVQLIRPDKRLGGARPAADVFEPLEIPEEDQHQDEDDQYRGSGDGLDDMMSGMDPTDLLG